MSEEQLHELARKVMEAIKPNQNLDLEEFALRIVTKVKSHSNFF